MEHTVQRFVSEANSEACKHLDVVSVHILSFLSTSYRSQLSGGLETSINQWEVAVFSEWEGNRGFSVALAMSHTLPTRWPLTRRYGPRLRFCVVCGIFYLYLPQYSVANLWNCSGSESANGFDRSPHTAGPAPAFLVPGCLLPSCVDCCVRCSALAPRYVARGNRRWTMLHFPRLRSPIGPRGLCRYWYLPGISTGPF